MADPATDPHHDLHQFPQDPHARQPGERLAAWRARRCSPGGRAPRQEGDPVSDDDAGGAGAG